MYTKHPSPGKFEGNHSQWMAQAAYAASMDGPDEEFGDAGQGKHVCLVLGKRQGFILVEDSNGFVGVIVHPREEAIWRFSNMAQEHQDPNLCEGCGEVDSKCECFSEKRAPRCAGWPPFFA